MKKIVLSVLVILLVLGYFSGTVSASNLYQVRITPEVAGVDNLINNMNKPSDKFYMVNYADYTTLVLNK